MKLIATPLLVLLLVGLPAQADIYKCQAEDGHAVFQGTPCEGKGEAHTPAAQVSRINSPPVVPRSISSRVRKEAEKSAIVRARVKANRRYRERQNQERLERQARRAGMVARGMSEREATRMYGKPDRVSVSQSGLGNCKHMTWEGSRRRVMTCNGEVKSSYAY